MNKFCTIVPRISRILSQMIKIWALLVESIFPLSPLEKQVQRLSAAEVSAYYQPMVHDTIIFLAPYRTHAMTALVTTAKFSHNDTAARLLAGLLTRWLTEHNQAHTKFIPIPLHPKRERERGYNQVTQVLKKIPPEYGTLATNILFRQRHTPPQTTLDKTARAKNICGAFKVDQSALRKILSEGTKRIILCDDVYTTGSTLKEAWRVLGPLLPTHCELICLTWTH